MERRNFLVKSGLGVAGLGLLPALSIKDCQIPTSNAFFPAPGSDDGILAEAKANIVRVRMKPVFIKILKPNGTPLANTRIGLQQQNHCFLFGDNNVPLDVLFKHNMHNSTEGRNWKDLYTKVFNAINCTCYWTEKRSNNMNKTEEFQGEQRLESFDYSVNWALSEGLTVKGHPMFWGVDKAIPEWVKHYDNQTQQKFLEVRIRNLAARYKNKVKVWDAVNEMLWEPAPKNLKNRHWPHIESVPEMVDYIKPVLQWAREEDPDAQYLINDYGTDNTETNAHNIGPDGKTVTADMQRKRMINLAQALKEAGQVPSALGLQSHSGGWMRPSDQVQFYNQMQLAGLPLHVTEFWAHTNHLESVPYPFPENGDFKTAISKPLKPLPPEEVAQKQADYVSNYLTIAFSHPAIEAFFFWGFMGMAINSKGDSYTLRPVYEAVRKLIKEDWMTNKTLETNSEGEIKANTFLGNYKLRYPLITGGPFAASEDLVISKTGPENNVVVARLAI